ncbi:CDK9 [Lepeophtheirus salmonis]|uniref:CDK9 n=1 Tax=Lepeophtheirus salmonis TaxID=72036 RepID=A0A7R8GYR9_LEPSM|nr:CDK9 [Lepeophtheirus salmonis]CAF2752680.1 CDK9 [Lepeophtheirus salmonis]
MRNSRRLDKGLLEKFFKARDKKVKNKLVALKKVLMENEKEGFPITALREIRILQLLRHENISLIFCEHDLAGLLSNFNVKFSLGEIKKVMQQLLNGLYYIHSNKIIHRDMKAANVLISKQGKLKLADFGLARAISINKGPNRYTNRVVTLWYRPPELLLGERNYGPPVDLWGAGCIMAEMWTRSPIMQGNTEQHQLTLIAQLCGAITPDVWPGVENLELYNKLEIPKNQKRRVKERLKPYVKDQYAVDLLDKLLCLCPTKRLDADTALNHDFFWTDPMPLELEKMLSQHNQTSGTTGSNNTGAPNNQMHRNRSHQPPPEGFMDRMTTIQNNLSNTPNSSQKGISAADKDRYIENCVFPYCTKVDKYEKMTKIGQGTFGEVFKARLRADKSKIVALKKVLMENEKEGFPITALREIRILQLLKHDNIVNLHEICRHMILLVSYPMSMFNSLLVKLKKDMKAANILITRQGCLKLADFGLARAISINKNGQPNRYTNRVVTLWYRPPELLLGERNYGPPVDLWGAGCIMAEMWTRSPIMQGNTEQHQLTLIAQLCGALTPEVWRGIENLELHNKMELPKGSKRRVKERLKPYVKDPYACDLIDKTSWIRSVPKN